MKIYTLHSVADNGLSLPVASFLSFVRYLNRKYDVICPERFACGDWDDSCAMLTFDDCFSDNFSNALPILTEYDIRAIFFCVVEYHRKIVWGSIAEQRWSEEKGDSFNIPFSFMSFHELKVLKELGHEIGCHTHSHRNLDELTSNDLQHEILGARCELETELQVPIRYFAYPRGRHNQLSVDAVDEAGFEFAFTTRPERVSHQSLNKMRLQVPRFPVAKSRLFGWN